MIRVENLYKTFGEIRALKGITFSVKRGEVVGLLGPNGAGKTTTMRIVTGFLNADSGSVYIDGVSTLDDPMRAKGEIGYLPEGSPLYLDMEVTDFLAYIAALRGIPVRERPPRIREMVELCGLRSVVGRTIGKLSRGYRQRVGLAHALIHHPKIMILDEPTAGLDPNQIAEMRDLIKEIGRERTVVLSTHIMQEVEATCDRAIIINRGELVGDGYVRELIEAHSSPGRDRATMEDVFRSMTAGD